MITRIATTIIFLVIAISSSYASESERIEQLESEIQEINERLSKLESILENRKEKKLVLTNNGWKSLANWRMLKTGMNYAEVNEILGEPHRVFGGMTTGWFYKNDGEVMFFDGEVRKWSEPR